jgi:hypothetical protein
MGTSKRPADQKPADLYERAGCCSPRTLSHLSTFGASLLATNWPLIPRRHSPVVKLFRDPFNRPHSRAVAGITPNTLLREVFSAKFHFTKALLHKMASPGYISMYRILRNTTVTTSGRHLLSKIVCPKLRVSPLNAQTDSRVFRYYSFKCFFIGTQTSIFRYIQQILAINSAAHTPYMLCCVPLSFANQDKVRCIVSLAIHFGRICLPAPTTPI